MKRWLIYFAVLALCGVSASPGTDIGRLTPIEAVWAAEENGQVFLQTDTGVMGRGDTVEGALLDMKAASHGTIFLDTADYLIIEEGQEMLLTQMYEVLRPSCMVCTAIKKPDMETVTGFLSAHEPGLTLRSYRAERVGLPVLRIEEGRYEWLDS